MNGGKINAAAERTYPSGSGICFVLSVDDFRFAHRSVGCAQRLSEEAGTERGGYKLGNGIRKPYKLKSAETGEYPSGRKKHDELATYGNDKTVYGISDCLTYGAGNDRKSGKNIVRSDNPQSGYAYFEHFLGGIEE